MPDDQVKIDIGADTTDANASLKDLERKSKKTFDKMSTDAEKSANETAAAFKRSGIRTEKAIRESSEQAKKDFDKIKRSGVASANDIKRAHNVMTERLKRNSRELSTKTKKMTGVFDKLKTSIIAVSVAAAGFFGVKSFKEAINFEAALAELQKVMKDGEGQAADYTDQIEVLQKKFGESGAEILQGVAKFKQAGFGVAESFKLQESAMKLALASELDVVEASDLITRTLKGFKAPATEAIRLTDSLNAISNKYATNLKELAIGTSELSPIAKKMGFSFEETASILTPVIEVFGSGSEAAQALKTGLLKLIDDMVPVQSALAKMGISQEDYNKQLRSGKDILKDVAARFETLDGNQKLFITSQITGIRQAGKMSEVFDGLGLSTQVLNDAMNSKGSIDKEVNRVMETTKHRGKQAREEFNLMAKAIGNALLPAWNKIIDIAIPTMSWLTREIKEMTKAFGLLGTAISFLWNPFTFFDRQKVQAEKLRIEAEKTNKAKKEALELSKKQAAASKKEVIPLIEIEKIRKEQKDQINDNRDTTLQALDAQTKAQIAHNNVIKKAISDTKKELRTLQKEAETAAKFFEKIQDVIAASEVKIAQQGFDPMQKLVDDFERAQEAFKEAARAQASGDADEARELTLNAVKAATAILEVQEGAQRGSKVGFATMYEARIEAERLVEASTKFAEKMQAAADGAVPAVEQKLADLQTDLQAGKDTLASIKDSIKEARALAVDLKAKLSENTTATHTQIINTVHTGGGADIPGMNTGGGLKGYGGGDRRLRLLEDGEHVIRKESVKKIGRAAAEAFNRGDVQGLIDKLPIQGMNTGGEVKKESSPTRSVDVNLSLDGNTYSMQSDGSVADNFVKKLKNVNIVRGRKKNPY